MAIKNSRFQKIKRDALALWDEQFHPDNEPSRLHKFIHFWVLVAKSFQRNRCPIRASALSYTTLLALIPMLAVAMSVTSLFLKSKGEEQIESFIQQAMDRIIPQLPPGTNSNESAEFPTNEMAEFSVEDTNTTASVTETNLSADTNQPVVASAPETNTTNAPAPGPGGERVAAAKKGAALYIHKFIQNTYSGTLGAAGVVALFWTAIVMLIRIEETFNDIWGVSRGRDWWSRVTSYLTTLFVTPLLLLAALGLASGPHFHKARALLEHLPFLQFLLSQLLPIIVIGLTFALFYKFLPNTKVHFTAALVGGMLAGAAWHIFNQISLHLATRAITASKIYGGLALVPLLMLGLWAVWVMVLFGAQVAYAFQNRQLYFQERLVETVNQRGREFVSLRLMTCIGQRFQRGQLPPTVQQMSEELGIPSRLVQQVLQTLIAAHLVIEVSGAEQAYAPGRPLENINAHHILQAMRARGQELLTREEPVREEVYGEFARIQEAEKQAASSISMLALVNRADARLELTPPPPREKEIEISPALVPTQKPQTESAPQTPEAPIAHEVRRPARVEQTAPIPSPSTPPAVEIAKAEPEPKKPTGPTASVVEPVSDEERDFPL